MNNKISEANVDFIHEQAKTELTRDENEWSWPNLRYLQRIFAKYGREYEFDVFRKEILPNLYPEIFDMLFDRKEHRLEAVFMLKGHRLDGVHEEISSPVYLRKFSEVFKPYINEEIDAILGYFGASYDEYAEQYQKEIESDQEIAELIAFEYSEWETETFTFGIGGEEMDCESYLVTYWCDVATGKSRRKY